MVDTGDQKKLSVIFVCTGNSCRSQMAEGFLRHWAGDKIDVKSAGSHPADEVSRLSVQVMHEVGIDVSDHYTKSLDSVAEERFDWVITLCDFARDFCPDFRSRDGSAKVLHWSIPDPHRASNDPREALEAYRSARDDIARRIVEWLKETVGIKIVYDPR